ncbi:uncharacterized protein LOC143597807 [Bidens hawaiensis]|uniref:uncharacterized protein LOC143597807 n=1 Tax=Bidens hawaiensis TaxID=980011 RepID=UPI00404A71F1
MISDSKLPVKFWSEAVVEACYTLNRVLTVKKFGKMCFELLNLRKPNLKWLEPFGSMCTVLDPSGKFGPKSMEGFFVGYASSLRRVYIPSIHKIVQVQNVDCQRYTPNIQRPGNSRLFDYESIWESFKLPKEDFSEETLTMIYNKKLSESQVTIHEEPVSIPQEVADHVQSDDVPESYPALVTMREGIDYNEVYALVARLEAIQIYLAFAYWKGFKVYQLDVKSAFLNGKISEEVNVGQP